MTTRDKAIDRAAKLQAQMESEHKLGNSQAAEAFAAAMQRLMLEHELNDHEVERARMAGTKVPEEPIVETWVKPERLGIKTKKARSANLETMAAIIGRAHLCRIIIKRHTNFIGFVGTARHAEVAEYMLATLYRALGKIAKESYERTHHATVPPTPLPGYQTAFKRGFLMQLASRYEAERQRVAAEHDAANNTGTALMRLDGALQRVDRYMDERFAGPRFFFGAGSPPSRV